MSNNINDDIAHTTQELVSELTGSTGDNIVKLRKAYAENDLEAMWELNHLLKPLKRGRTLKFKRTMKREDKL